MTLIGPSLTGISKSRYFLTLNISETTRDRAVVTIEHQYEVIGSLSNGNVFNAIHGLLTRFSRSRHFEVEYLKNGASYGQSYYST